MVDVVFKLLAFMVLTPLAGVTFRTMIALSGKAFVSDLDIATLFLGPVGLTAVILGTALTLSIVAVEQTALIGIVCAKQAGKSLSAIAAIQFAAAKAWPVIQVAVRIVIGSLLAVAPFLVIAGIVYFSLLTEYDINYYLKEKPSEFTFAVGVGVVLALAAAVLLLRLFSGWFFALPLVVFENVSPRDALRLSAQRATGHRRKIVIGIVCWGAAIATLSLVISFLTGALADAIIPDSTASLRLLTVIVGFVVLVFSFTNLMINLLGTCTFAALLFNLYQDFGRGDNAGDITTDIANSGADHGMIQITRTRLIATCVIGCLVAVGIGAATLQSVRLDDDVMIMAHRGASREAPENTLAAFKKAIEAEADWIELDVQESADGEIVVFHDSDFMKLSKQNLKIWDATDNDLKEIDIGSWYGPDYSAERVPTLAEVLDLCKGKIKVNIELKYYGHDQQLEQRVAEVVESRDMTADVMAMSLKIDGVKKMKSIRPDWKVGLLMSVAVGNVKNVEADFLAVNAGFADRRLIRSAHANGKEVYVWTVNDAATMSTMIGRGVDGLLTDNPALARSVLKQRAEMSVAERLLLEIAVMLGTTPPVADQ